jgi:hypothetical protein
MQQDPIGYGTDDNLYWFVRNRPTTAIDPTGLEDDNPAQGNPPAHLGGYGYFLYCNRDFDLNNTDKSTKCVMSCLNKCCPFHTFLDYVYPSQYGPIHEGWGWAGGPWPTRNTITASHCDKCWKTGGTLQDGVGAGKKGNVSDYEIEDCIRNHKPTQPYKALGYNCAGWAREAAVACGLQCPQTLPESFTYGGGP